MYVLDVFPSVIRRETLSTAGEEALSEPQVTLRFELTNLSASREGPDRVHLARVGDDRFAVRWRGGDAGAVEVSEMGAQLLVLFARCRELPAEDQHLGHWVIDAAEGEPPPWFPPGVELG